MAFDGAEEWRSSSALWNLRIAQGGRPKFESLRLPACFRAEGRIFEAYQGLERDDDLQLEFGRLDERQVLQNFKDFIKKAEPQVGDRDTKGNQLYYLCVAPAALQQQQLWCTMSWSPRGRGSAPRGLAVSAAGGTRLLRTRLQEPAHPEQDAPDGGPRACAEREP